MRRNNKTSISFALSLGRSLLPNSPTPLLDSQLLLSHTLNTNKEYLIKNPNQLIANHKINRFLFQIGKRSTNYPIAYILKKKEFYGLDFYINEGVLIPRPETEMIVDIALDYIKTTDTKKINVLDLGTGSGCIPISLLIEISKLKNIQKDISIDAVDKSEVAIKISKNNLKKLSNKENTKIKLNFVKLDYVLQDIKKEYDEIISNPPYLTKREILKSQGSAIRYEPKEALFGKKENGLYYYKIIADKWLQKMSAKGIAILEIGTQELSEYKKIFKKYSIKVIKDFAGQNRFLVISHRL